MKKLTKHILVYTTIAACCYLILLGIAIITYKYDVSNCQKILSLSYQIAQEDTVNCVKIINTPIYSYYLPHIFGDLIVSFLIIGFIGLIHGFIRATNDDFEEHNIIKGTDGEYYYY